MTPSAKVQFVAGLPSFKLYSESLSEYYLDKPPFDCFLVGLFDQLLSPTHVVRTGFYIQLPSITKCLSTEATQGW